MINIKDKKDCCGCTACSNICPVNAIKMVADYEGFLYPRINKNICINCNACEKVCPEINGFKKETIKRVYVVRHKDVLILSSSTSGGAFSAFAESILKKGGIVFGVCFDSNYSVVHTKIKSIDELVKLRGSKYVQSNLNDIFKNIKMYLQEGKKVLFSGTSCQIAGLTSYLKKDYKNLLTIEVICHGTPSPLLWYKYLRYQEEKYNSKFKNISFRNKTYGYHSSTMEILFENGKKYTGSARTDFMLKSFFSEISSRPSCYSCICKGKERPSDLSIFDCWHAEILVPKLVDDDKGYTNVLVNTEKGEIILKEISEYIELYTVNIEKAIKLDGIMICNYPKKHPKREKFYYELNKNGLENTIYKMIPISKKDYIIENSKSLFYRLGIFNFLRIIKNGRRKKT